MQKRFGSMDLQLVTALAVRDRHQCFDPNSDKSDPGDEDLSILIGKAIASEILTHMEQS
jgi:hypothetical protein